MVGFPPSLCSDILFILLLNLLSSTLLIPHITNLNFYLPKVVSLMFIVLFNIVGLKFILIIVYFFENPSSNSPLLTSSFLVFPSFLIYLRCIHLTCVDIANTF